MRSKNIYFLLYIFYLVLILSLYLRVVEELNAVSFLVVDIDGVVYMKLVVVQRHSTVWSFPVNLDMHAFVSK